MTSTQALRNPEAVMSRQDIVSMLDEHNVPWRESWGIPPARTFEDFCRYHEKDRLYFRNGDCNGNGMCHTNGNGNGLSAKFIFDLHAAVVIVTHRYRHKWLELYEDRQVFPNGTILRRPNFDGIGETIRRLETIPGGARRCLKEELRFGDPSKYELSKCCHVEHRDPCPSEKWPGTWAAFHRHKFECVISRELFRTDGYVEEERDGRRIYFKWRPRGQFQLPI